MMFSNVKKDCKSLKLGGIFMLLGCHYHTMAVYALCYQIRLLGFMRDISKATIAMATCRLLCF